MPSAGPSADEGGILQGPWTLAHYFVAFVILLHIIAVVRQIRSVELTRQAFWVGKLYSEFGSEKRKRN